MVGKKPIVITKAGKRPIPIKLTINQIAIIEIALKTVGL